MQTKSVSRINDNSPVPQVTLQVEAQLDSAAFSMESLESTVATLINRLSPVSADYDDSLLPAEPTVSLVPVAARICHLDGRVRSIEARLSRALGALEI